MFDPRVDDLTRRSLLGAAAVAAGGVALAGCGGGDSSKTTTDAAVPPGPRKQGGTLRVGMSDSSSTDSLDPAFYSATYTNIALGNNLYNTLTVYDKKAPKAVNSLAAELTPASDLSYWDVRLRDANWHDGKPVTADDVIFTIKRVLDPKLGSTSASFLGSVDPKGLRKLDSKTVRIKLTYPDRGIPDALPFVPIVPVGFDPEKPIGSGPFKFVSSKPGERTVLARNDDYWQAELPYLDRVELVGFADPGAPRLNALASGQIDGVDHVDPALVPTIESKPDIKVLVSPSFAFHVWEMRQDAAPFDDVRVRQAIRLIADREQIVQQAFGGKRFATVGNDLGAPQDPLFDRALPQRQQDIEQAKSLLKQAGQENMKVELAVANISPGILQTAQVLKQNAQAAGVTIDIKNITDIGTYFNKYYYQAPFKVNYYNTTEMFVYVAAGLVKGGAYNISGYDNPQFDKLVTQARGTLDDTAAKQAMADAQKLVYDEGTQGIFAYTRTADAHNKKFVGFQTDLWGFSLNQLRFDDISSA